MRTILRLVLMRHMALERAEAGVLHDVALITDDYVRTCMRKRIIILVSVTRVTVAKVSSSLPII